MIIEKNVRNMKAMRCDWDLYSCELLTPGVLRPKNIPCLPRKLEKKKKKAEIFIEMLGMAPIFLRIAEKD